MFEDFLLVLELCEEVCVDVVMQLFDVLCWCYGCVVVEIFEVDLYDLNLVCIVCQVMVKIGNVVEMVVCVVEDGVIIEVELEVIEGDFFCVQVVLVSWYVVICVQVEVQLSKC